MANLTATVGSSSLTLYGGNPYSLVSARGMSSAAVRRVTSRGPAQDGDTDLGYRLAPRTIELTIGIRATSDILLDGYRQTFTSFFKPLPSTPIQLRYTGDNAAVRQIDCYTVGDIKLNLNPEHRPGHYHEATVTLRAADPAWYNPTQGSVTVLGTSFVGATWWLAGGAIGTAQVVEYGTAPTQGQVWTYTGTPDSTASPGAYTIAIRSGQESLSAGKFAFFAGDGDGDPSVSIHTYFTVSAVYGYGNPNNSGGRNFSMPSGTSNYIFSTLGTTYTRGYIDGTALPDSVYSAVSMSIEGTARRWRSDATNSVGSRWSEALEKYAVYVPALDTSQIAALNEFMNIPAGNTDTQYLAISYVGNLPEYPIISLTGPATNPSITNLTTGETLDFGTITIGAGTTYMIDTRYGYKTVLDGTVSRRYQLTEDSDVATFHLAPTTGGTNVLFLDGTAMGTATRFSVAYYNRYTSF